MPNYGKLWILASSLMIVGCSTKLSGPAGAPAPAASAPSAVSSGAATAQPQHLSPGNAAQAPARPCAPFLSACKAAGFVLNGKAQGNRLIGDCLTKLVAGQAAVSAATNQTAQPPAGANAAACAASIHHSSGPPPRNAKLSI